jgi:hypothetical protein
MYRDLYSDSQTPPNFARFAFLDSTARDLSVCAQLR